MHLETHCWSGSGGIYFLPNGRASHSTGLPCIMVFDHMFDKI